MSNKTQQTPTYSVILFSETEVIIIESATGTGKHQQLLHIYMNIWNMKNKEVKLISITPRETLTEQHVESFKHINCIQYKIKATNKIMVFYGILKLSRCVRLVKKHIFTI